MDGNSIGSLCLRRLPKQSIDLHLTDGRMVVVHVESISGSSVLLRIAAPIDIKIFRTELNANETKEIKETL